MKLSLNKSFVSLLACVIPSHAITLLQVLQSYSELTTLSSYVNASSNATALLANANNFTFLASSNAAIASFLSKNPNVLTADLLQATLEYSLLRGGYPTLSFSDTPQFVASNLVNSSYANVTGGQTVELLQSSGGAETLSGNKTISTSSSADIVCTGGIIHIIDTVPSIPVSAVSEITAANLEYFVSILNVGGYLNPANAYVNQILEVPDVTYFIPNSAAALANVTEQVKNTSAAELQSTFEYHVVPGFVGYSTLLTNGMQLKTAEGGNLTVTVQGGEMYINAAKVVASDYIVANGVVHVIDK
ncbi:FAS1 domain-containing protein [Mollisia scopiformis]|uniref:FAS1 domain-containing protein n=1 Tax=Mollisia scopiformis TaxID=149040 RepID=A0A194WWZ0_MOLSC|nr:FAS1 domain-containing protein [Mollisia scopiformis]KUJ12199.1 FAS1 domain-containing protein [Mollisia scopiformis]